MTVSEQILSVIPGATEHQRLVIVHRSMDSRGSVQLHWPAALAETDEPSGNDEASWAEETFDRNGMPTPDSQSLPQLPFCKQLHSIRERPIVLRQESFSSAVGWFTQSEMDLTTDQWSAMRTTLIPVESNRSLAPRNLRRGRSGLGRSGLGRSRTGRSVSGINAQRTLAADGNVVSLVIDSDRAVSA